MNTPDDQVDKEKYNSWAYRIGKLAGELYKQFQSPEVKTIRSVMRVLDLTTHLGGNDIYQASTQFSDNQMLNFLDQMSFDIDGDNVTFRLPGLSGFGQMNIKTGECLLNHQKRGYHYNIHNKVESISPNFLSQVTKVDLQKRYYFKKSDSDGVGNLLMPFSFLDEESLRLAHMEYLLSIRALKLFPNPEFIRIISLLLLKMPKEYSEFAMRDQKNFVYNQLLFINYVSLLKNPEKYGIKMEELHELVMSEKFLSERLYEVRND